MAKMGKTSRFGSSFAIAMRDIVPSPYQVRVDYGDIEGLSRDIEEKGLIEPVLVRPIDGNKFELVHGHRRYKAIESLGWSHIDGFCKQLTDSEAITIQGSENIWRKDYTPIEEARLYYNYRMFLEKEQSKRIPIKDVAEAFKTSEDNVDSKINLLELPKEIQDKLQHGQIPFSKVRKLTLLTRMSDPTTVVSDNGGFLGSEPAPRTTRFYSDIKALAEEIKKGALGGLRTEKGVAEAAQAIRNGIDYEDAVQKAKVNEAVELAQEQLKKGKAPEEILTDILSHQTDPSEIVEATREANLGLLKKLLTQKLILCPHCGKPDLAWACNGEPVVKEDEEAN